MSRCACELFGPHLQRPLHELHENVAQMVREQQERAARYIAALNARRHTRTEPRGLPPSRLALPSRAGSRLPLANFTTEHVAQISEERRELHGVPRRWEVRRG